MDDSYPEVEDKDDNEGLRWMTESNWLGVLDKFLKSMPVGGGVGEGRDRWFANR